MEVWWSLFIGVTVSKQHHPALKYTFYLSR